MSSSADQEAAESTETNHDDPTTPSEPTRGKGVDGDVCQVQPSNEVPYSIWNPTQKRLIVLGVTLASLFGPISAHTYMPALNVLAEEFHVTPTKINLTVTTYVVFQGVTPMLVGGFTDSLGRRPILILCFVVYLAANIGLAEATQYSHMLITRCFQSAGIASIMILCQSIVVDIVTNAERGQYLAITAIPQALGPSLGPVIGGALTKYLGWRSIFWFLAISVGVVFVVLAIVLPETCRKVVGDGSVRPPPIYLSLLQWLQRRRHRPEKPQNFGSLEPRPQSDKLYKFVARQVFSALLLLRDKELALLACFGGVTFSGFYGLSASAPRLLATRYDLDELQIGLMFLPLAGGSIIGVAIVGPCLGWNLRRHARARGITITKGRDVDLAGFPIERARLEMTVPLLLLSAGMLFAWGWAPVHGAHVAVLCVTIFLSGVALIGVNATTQALIADLYPERAAAALATYTLSKCLLGSVASAVVEPMIASMGQGYAFTVFGGVYLLLLPLLLVVMRRGVQWRDERREGAAKQ